MKVKHYFTGPYEVNAYIVYDDTKSAYIVDPGGYKPELNSFIVENELNLEYIVLTHGHGDHIGGVEQLKDLYPQAKVVAHRNEKEMLESPYQNSSIEIYGRPITITADIWVEDGQELQCGDMTINSSTLQAIQRVVCAYYVEIFYSAEIHYFRCRLAEQIFMAVILMNLLIPSKQSYLYSQMIL